MMHLALSLLGEFQITPETDLGYDKVRALLAYLALNAGQPCARETLATLLWGEQAPSAARHSLSQALHKLRDALASSELFHVNRATIQFDPPPDFFLDARAFNDLLAQNAQHTHTELCAECLARLERAVELYRGEFLAGLVIGDSATFEDWVVARREELHRRVLDALAQLTHAYLRQRDFARAQQFAARQLELEPFREEAHRALMEIFARTGQRAAALAQYENCRAILAAEFGIEPSAETRTLAEQIRARGAVPPHNLPLPLAPLIGRASELAIIAARLADPACRLLTLTGPGGIGKTTLALHAAADQLGDWMDGVFFISLASAQNVAQAEATLIAALAIPQGHSDARTRIGAFLRDQTRLLILDNCEQIADLATLVRAILDAAPRVKLVITAREPLNLRDEWIVRIEGLADVRDAHVLFTHHAQRVAATFAPSADDLAAMTRITEILRGSPLGILLAAGWIEAFSCRAILEQMQADLDFLATPLRDVETRHSSLRAVFEHSWCLLSPTDQSALARLSIFCNPFRHTAARAVAEVTPPQLAAFVRKSWLHLAPDERYELHPLLRQFLAEKLAAHPADEHATRARHAAHFANVMMQMHQREQAGRTDQAQAAVKLVIEDVIAAFQWAVAEREFELIDQMIPYGYRYFAVAGQYQIGKTLFASAVEELRETRDADDRATMILAKLLGYTGVLKMFLVEYAEAQAHLETSLALARRLGAHAQASLALHSLGFIATEQGHHSQAKQLLEEALVLRRQNSGDTVPILATLGRLALETGAPAQARVRYDAAVALAPTGRTPLTPNIAIALHGLGRAYQRLGEPDQARRVLEQSLGMCRALEHKLGTARCLADLGRLATDAGDFATATAHLAASVRLLREIGKTNEAALALREQGWLSEAQNDYIAARHAYASSEEWLAQMPNQLYSAVVHADLGRVCAWLNDFRAAETFLASARALAEETQSTYGAMLAHASWGIVARARGEWQEAREHLRAALRLSVDAQEVYEALKTLVELADTLAQMGACERAATLSAFALAHPATPQHYKARAQAIVARVPEPSTRVQTLTEIVTLVNQDPQGL